MDAFAGCEDGRGLAHDPNDFPPREAVYQRPGAKEHHTVVVQEVGEEFSFGWAARFRRPAEHFEWLPETGGSCGSPLSPARCTTAPPRPRQGALAGIGNLLCPSFLSGGVSEGFYVFDVDEAAPKLHGPLFP